MALAINQVFPSSWRGPFRLRWLNWMFFPMDHHDQQDSFVWRRGRDLVVLRKNGESWLVSCTTQGKLLGPAQRVYEATHRQAKFAAWDVMSKVISVSHDEDEGVEVAVRAARWMRGDDGGTGQRA